MQRQKQKQKISLANLFKKKAQQIIKRQPPLYMVNFVKQEQLLFNLTAFKIDDFCFVEVLFMMPYKKIRIFQQQKNPKKKQKEDQILVKPFHETYKFKDLLRLLNGHILKSQTLRVLNFERVHIVEKFMDLLNNGISDTKYLKEFTMKNCQLKDGHLQRIKAALASNKSLTKLDLSMNLFCQSGAMIGKILSDHSMRRTQILWMYGIRHQEPDYDLANTGICELNLSHNQFNDKSAYEMITFIKDDDWTRCINLKNNKIGKQGIRQFAIMMKTQKVLVSLDLRQNEGFTKELSRFIYKKLHMNLQAYKKLKQIYKNTIHTQRQQEQPEDIFNKSKLNNNILQEINSPRDTLNLNTQKENHQLPNHNQFKAHFNSFKASQTVRSNKGNKSIQFKSTKKLKNEEVKMIRSHRNNRDLGQQNNFNLKQETKNNHNLSIPNQYHSNRKKHENSLSINKKDLTTLGSKQISSINIHPNLNQSLNMNAKGTSSRRVYNLMQSQEKYSQNQCKRCHENSLKCLRLEKQNIYLELQIRKLKHFICKNVEISAIQVPNRLNITDNANNPNNQNQNISSSSFNRYLSSDNDEDMIFKIQHMMSELTKIMENVQLNQNTQNNISNAISNPHSFSNTIPLYDRKSQILQLSKQINEDEDLTINLNLNAISSLEQEGNYSRTNNDAFQLAQENQ